MTTIASQASGYISEHRFIRECMARGLVNHSALARLMMKDLKLRGRATEAALIAASRRYARRLKPPSRGLAELFKRANLEIKNNIIIFTLGKSTYPDALLDVEKSIKKGGDVFFAIEGTRTITLIAQEQSRAIIEKRLWHHIQDRKGDLSLITLTCPGIDRIPGAVGHIGGLFYEQGVNIEEFMSCYDDTLAVISSKDLGKMVSVLAGLGK